MGRTPYNPRLYISETHVCLDLHLPTPDSLRHDLHNHKSMQWEGQGSARGGVGEGTGVNTGAVRVQRGSNPRKHCLVMTIEYSI